MRKRLAAALIRLAHYIYRPTVTEVDWDEFTAESGFKVEWDRDALPPERRESRGWEQQ
ncbi:hypothetical protein [Nocardia farcinica]|uniref:hypothetical protein n=1 Tax=Nocardia farcinica TaxID=37329 RepID=UPI0024567DFC|nr:hypothetical protein [Nocardia farcinica]